MPFFCYIISPYVPPLIQYYQTSLPYRDDNERDIRYQKRRASLREEKKQQKRETLRTFLIDVFEQNGYNKKNTAKVLGITPRQLTGMCRKHDIDHENWKIARSYYIKENGNEK